NYLHDNLVGIDIHGARNALIKGNRIEGLQLKRMNDRGNGIYVWNAPGSVVEDNEIRYGRDGIFSNSSKRNVYRGNLMRDLRFAVHYMYTNDSEIVANISIGNHLGFAMMYSDRIVARDNISISDRDYGVMLNYTNQSDIFSNQVIGGVEKCAFVYNAHRNLLAENRFEGCDIGIHFTAGSERNTVTGNAFIGNRTQVKYVGTRDVEWSFDGRGNFWSDHPSFDLNGDARADSIYRPNDLMDHILWSQPAAKLLIGAPAVQLVRWSQEQFPATAPGGVIDSHPLIAAPDLAVPQDILLLVPATPLWATGASDDDAAHFKLN
ncbi:MAG TPA: nitrous oxide reductase family maturation protein NosD, partial [Paracoccaceae bacterium]|nr:nitrous oxide reductase family maturation protein NosD [Paracoccaceae bacterium]